MDNQGKAILKGGLGCFAAFAIFALLAVVTGGRAHFDLGGIVILFIIGGAIGWVVNWIYQKGRRDSESVDDDED